LSNETEDVEKIIIFLNFGENWLTFRRGMAMAIFFW